MQGIDLVEKLAELQRRYADAHRPVRPADHYSFAAYPAGAMSDRVNRLTMLIIGFALLIAADTPPAFLGFSGAKAL